MQSVTISQSLNGHMIDIILCELAAYAWAWEVFNWSNEWYERNAPNRLCCSQEAALLEAKAAILSELGKV
ncbi:MAG TPA: hypothetical protein VN289_04775 [Paraburkholderia sp.]|jgi:hypothetical protein|nr:hypothetical protein [Paraburkholderia sp.]